MTQEIELDFPWEDSDLIVGVSVKFWATYDRSTHSFSLAKCRLTAVRLDLRFVAWRVGVQVREQVTVTVPVDNGWIDAGEMKAIELWAEHYFWEHAEAAMLARQEKVDEAVNLADAVRDRT